MIVKPWSDRSRNIAELEAEAWGKMSAIPGIRAAFGAVVVGFTHPAIESAAEIGERFCMGGIAGQIVHLIAVGGPSVEFFTRPGGAEEQLLGVASLPPAWSERSVCTMLLPSL